LIGFSVPYIILEFKQTFCCYIFQFSTN